jgi:hypothetical protein
MAMNGIRSAMFLLAVATGQAGASDPPSEIAGHLTPPGSPNAVCVAAKLPAEVVSIRPGVPESLSEGPALTKEQVHRLAQSTTQALAGALAAAAKTAWKEMHAQERGTKTYFERTLGSFSVAYMHEASLRFGLAQCGDADDVGELSYIMTVEYFGRARPDELLAPNLRHWISGFGKMGDMYFGNLLMMLVAFDLADVDVKTELLFGEYRRFAVEGDAD